MADINLQDLALAMALSYGGAHPMGHMSRASQYGVPGKVDFGRGVEMYDQNSWNKLTPAEQAKIHAAGFEGQQTLSNALTGSDMEEEMRLAQALYKLGYIAGVKPGGTDGDPELLSKTTGMNRGRMNALIGTSALADLYRVKRPGGKSSLDFGVLDEGRAPGLVYKMKF
jgi:hypothetical protein